MKKDFQNNTEDFQDSQFKCVRHFCVLDDQLMNRVMVPGRLMPMHFGDDTTTSLIGVIEAHSFHIAQYMRLYPQWQIDLHLKSDWIYWSSITSRPTQRHSIEQTQWCDVPMSKFWVTQSVQHIARQKQFPILVQTINKSMFIPRKYKCIWTRRSPWSAFMTVSCDSATRWSPSEEWHNKLHAALTNRRHPGTCPSFIKNSADLMNSEMVLDRYLLD